MEVLRLTVRPHLLEQLDSRSMPAGTSRLDGHAELELLAG
jgi:hypothetical protein